MHITTISSVQFSRSVVSDSLQPHESQHARPPCPSPTPGVHSDSRPSSQWAISSSVVPFSSCPQSVPASESFPMSQLFAWGGQSTGVSVLASFFPKTSQGWSPSEWTGWISLQSKGLSRVFSNTTVQKHQFFSAQPSSPNLLFITFAWSHMCHLSTSKVQILRNNFCIFIIAVFMKLDHISQPATNIYLKYDSAVFPSRIVSNLVITPTIKKIFYSWENIVIVLTKRWITIQSPY